MTIKDRLSLLLLLPTLGSVLEMVNVYDLARELKLSDEEKELVNYIENEQSIKWDAEKDPDKEININSDLKSILLKAVDILDAQKRVPLSMIELILKLKGYGEYKESDTTHT